LSVGEEPSNFRLQGKEVLVTGTWSVLPDRATETPFTASPSAKDAGHDKSLPAIHQHKPSPVHRPERSG